jgi:tetratricopeptide (TPR) repeat protein
VFVAAPAERGVRLAGNRRRVRMLQKIADMKSHISKQQDIVISEYEITDEPMANPYLKKLSHTLRKKVENLSDELYDMASAQPEQAVVRLKEAIRQYPDVPQFSNYLMMAYSKIGEWEKIDSLIAENYKRYPDYLFAKLNYAELCLRRKQIDEIPIIFDDNFDLKLLYPKRKKFHIAEVIGFMGIAGIYYHETGERKSAELCYSVLRQLNPQHEKTRRLKGKLYPSVFSKLFRR